ncbi:MAG: hypothetical protein RM022_001435 [Nostoc sp. EfeVER01]|uniref:hypothetical protein n=1 Tax=Nostoc sp. EfeVER01 TaxID=3075406 RepID=UPI002AD35463|nr:hypothetical protein [Nostoc sp. EfeVER01]MDZ7949332.1 hypothetical protein [Nostoc sp. EfeVER01]
MTKTVPMIRTLQHLGATREDITSFIKKAKSKKTSPKLDVCKNFDNTKIKPVLPNDAPIAVVLFAGGGGIEAGMVEAGIRPVIAVEFDPSKPDLSRAIAKSHHYNFNEDGCKIIQLTVQEVAQSGLIGFPRRPDYQIVLSLHCVILNEFGLLMGQQKTRFISEVKKPGRLESRATSR